MGILDDAIREHLELKRQHGVPEEELQRQEEEALGPARRDVAQQHEEASRPRPGRRRPPRPTSPRPRRGPGDRSLRHGVGRRTRPRVRAPPARPPWRRSSRASAEPIRRRAAGRRPSSRRRTSFEPVEHEPDAARPATRSLSRRVRGGATRGRGRGRGARGRGSPLRRGGGRGRGGRSRRAGGHARLPPGDSRARPALVRAEAASRLRLRLGGRPSEPAVPRELRRGAARPGDPPLDATQRRPVPLSSTEPSMPSYPIFRSPEGRSG